MFRALIRKLGARNASIGFSIAAVPLSVGLGALIDFGIKGHVPTADLLLMTIMPVLIGPPMAFGVMRLLEQLDESESKLRELSRHDYLTGLYTRRYCMELAEIELVRARRLSSSTVFLLLDVDEFKTINDTYGHSHGDRTLQQIAHTVKSAVRECDHVGRFGGEEFVVILPETSLEQGLNVAERVRREIERCRIAHESHQPTVTASIGVSVLNDPTTETRRELERALQLADDALYSAKRGGRNRTRAAPAPTPAD